MKIDELRENLLDANYEVDAVTARLGEAGQAGLHRNRTMPARHILGDARDAQATLISLFLLGQPVDEHDLAKAVNVSTLVDLELVRVDAGRARALADLRPYGFDYLPEDVNASSGGGNVLLESGGHLSGDGGYLLEASEAHQPTSFSGWVVADITPGLDNRREPMRPDYVLGVSGASSTLATMTVPTQVGRALDLGTGCGVQSLHLATHAESIVATDINPRALTLARLSAALNQVDVDFRAGSLYEPVAGEGFDLIVTNPPYVMSPPSRENQRLVYREAGFSGDDLVRQVVEGSAGVLNPGGLCQVLANWAITDDDWQTRLAGWCPPSCDLWVIERERLDRYAYIEMWLSDAGLDGDPCWEQAYRDWLDYFEYLGITAVGMGWITVAKTGRETPEIRIESWPYEVHQPVGADLAGFVERTDWARLDVEELLGSTWKIRKDIRTEQLGLPGEADPQFVVLRQYEGLKRAMNVGTDLGAILGACDGSMDLATITQAVADIVDKSTDAVVHACMPQIRQAIADGYLSRVG